MSTVYVAKRAEKKKLSTPHEGKLLSHLVDWSGLSKTEFCSKVGITTAWLRTISQRAIVPGKNKMSIFHKFNIPLDYWTGDYKLPAHPSGNPVSSSVTSMMLNEPVEVLRRLLEEKDKTIIELQNEIIRLMKENKN